MAVASPSWRASKPGEDGWRRIAVNLRFADPEAAYSNVVKHLDGLDSWGNLPRDGRLVAGIKL